MNRTPVKGISVIGRATNGVRLVSLRKDEDKVASVARVLPEDDSDEGLEVDADGVVVDDGASDGADLNPADGEDSNTPDETKLDGDDEGDDA